MDATTNLGDNVAANPVHDLDDLDELTLMSARLSELKIEDAASSLETKVINLHESETLLAEGFFTEHNITKRFSNVKSNLTLIKEDCLDSKTRTQEMLRANERHLADIRTIRLEHRDEDERLKAIEERIERLTHQEVPHGHQPQKSSLLCDLVAQSKDCKKSQEERQRSGEKLERTLKLQQAIMKDQIMDLEAMISAIEKSSDSELPLKLDVSAK